MKWAKRAAGHYRSGPWEIVEVQSGWWAVYYNGDVIRGIGGCTLRVCKHRIAVLVKKENERAQNVIN